MRIDLVIEWPVVSYWVVCTRCERRVIQIIDQDEWDYLVGKVESHVC